MHYEQYVATALKTKTEIIYKSKNN